MSTGNRQSSRGPRHHSSATFLCLHKFDVRGAQCLPLQGSQSTHGRTATTFWVRHLLTEHKCIMNVTQHTNIVAQMSNALRNSYNRHSHELVWWMFCTSTSNLWRIWEGFFCFANLKAAHKQNMGLTLSSEMKIMYCLFSWILKPNTF